MGCPIAFSLFSLILQSLLFAHILAHILNLAYIFAHILIFNKNQTFFNSPVIQLEQPIILSYSDLIFLAHADFQCLYYYLFLPV